MKVALIGGKELIDAVFLNNLSEVNQNLDLECYLDTGEVRFGTKRINIRNISELNLSDFDILVNLSNKYPLILERVKNYNSNSLKKIIYFNCQEGDLLIDLSNEVISKNLLILIPNFGVEPICKALKLFEPFSFISVFMCRSIAELGKESMHVFHKEIKESGYKIVQRNEETNEHALAFNISYDCKDNNACEFGDSESEIESKNQIYKYIQCSNLILTQARVCTNKGSSVMITFELKKNITEQFIKKKLENEGFVYAKYGFSTILTENDSQVYITKIKKCDKKYSFVLLFDSLQSYIINIVNSISNLN